MKKSTELEKDISLKSKFSIYFIQTMKLTDLLMFYSTSRLKKNWGQVQKSRYIESLLLGYPLTNFIIQGDYCNHAIIDGNERLTSIKDYIDNRLELTNLVRLDLERTKFKNLTLKRQKEFKVQKFQVTVLNNVIPDYIVKDIHNTTQYLHYE